MPSRPRLVYRTLPTSGGELDRQQPGAEVASAPEAWARERAPEASGRRDAMREVQMENIHPLRLRLLLEIERGRSISAAAQACGIGQPSASMHLRNLEATLGHRLVARDGRGSSLTAAGKVVASHAARMLATLDSMRRAVDALEARGAGELTIVASLTPSVVLLPPILGQLCDRYPGVTVRLRTLPSEAAVEQVARGTVDLGVAGEVRTAEPVARQRVAVDELVGIAAPGLVDPDHGWITLGQLARNRLLLGPKGSSTRTITERYLARAGYRPPPFWEFSSYETITQAVRQGLGVSFISRLLVRTEIEREELSAFRVSGVEQMLRPIHALHYSARELSPEASALMGLLADAPRGVQKRPAFPGSRSSATSWGFGS
jgi:LysR family transcriptional regulator, low CO2-responsive transcriptional regulator